VRRLGLLALLGLSLCACGSSHKAAPATTAAAPGRSAQPSAGGVRVAIIAPTHTPKVNANWPVAVKVSDAGGRPLAATLTMRVLFAGAPVGKVDNGRVYRFVGSWQEKPGQDITWPAQSRGQPLTFEAVVRAKGETVKRTWWIQSK